MELIETIIEAVQELLEMFLEWLEVEAMEEGLAKCVRGNFIKSTAVYVQGDNFFSEVFHQVRLSYFKS